jgi:hypothetical protein
MKQRVESRWIVIYAMILGIAYVILGATEFTLGIYSLFSPMDNINFVGVISADIFGGFAAIVIGATYLSATSILRGKYELWGYILIGLFLSIVYGAIYLLIVFADGFEALLAYWGGEGEWTWEWLTSGTAGPGLLRPEIWLFLASLPLAYLTLGALRQLNILGKGKTL